MKRQRGFSIIEMFCVLAIGLICLTLLMRIVLDYQKTNAYINAVSEIQENAFYAAYIIKHDIEHSGYIGCGQLTRYFPVVNHGIKLLNRITYGRDFMVFSSHKANSFLSSIGIKIKLVAHSQVIMIRHMSSQTSYLLLPIHGKHLVVIGDQKFKKQRDVMISNCESAELHSVMHVNNCFHSNNKCLTVKSDISGIFNNFAEIGNIKTRIYFIMFSGRKNHFGHKIYSLYILDENGHKSELVPNIADLRVECYKKISNGRLIKKSSNQVIDWSSIQAVKIYLLLKSEGNVLNKPMTLSFYHQPFHAKDRCLYKSYEFLVELRQHHCVV